MKVGVGEAVGLGDGEGEGEAVEVTESGAGFAPPLFAPPLLTPRTGVAFAPDTEETGKEQANAGRSSTQNISQNR